MNRFSLISAAALGAVLGSPLAAQDINGATFLGSIRITAAEAQALLGNDVITEEQIEDRNPDSIRDVFAGESSILTSGGASIATNVVVNGLEESLLAVTIDGARQNKAVFHHSGNVLLDPALLRQVEISAGIAPADAGPNATGGLIAYEFADAQDLLEPGDDFGGRLSLGAGSNGAGTRGSLSIFGVQGGFDYVLSATMTEGDDYDDGAGVTMRGTEPEISNYMARVGFTSAAGNRLSFSASQTEDTGDRLAQPGPGGLFFIRPDFGGVNGATNVLIEANSLRSSYTLTFEGDGFDGWLDPTVQLSFNEQELDASGTWGANTSFSGFIENEFDLGNGSATVGIDFFNETARGGGRGPGPFGGNGEENLQSAGIYAQMRQDLGERVSVSYGARYDWQEFEGADGTEFSDSGASVNASIDVILTDTLTLNAGAASTWGGFELGEAALVNFGTPWNYAGFGASDAVSTRIGLRYDNGRFAASGAYFRTEINDIAAVLPRGGARGSTTDLETEGFDISLAYTGDRGFVRLNFTHADVLANGSDISTTAYYLGRPVGSVGALEFAYDLNGEWRVGGSAQFALENELVASTLPSYEVVNLYATYQPRNIDGLELRLDVENLFDETYASRSSDGIDNARIVPLNEPGRTLRLTAVWEF